MPVPTAPRTSIGSNTYATTTVLCAAKNETEPSSSPDQLELSREELNEIDSSGMFLTLASNSNEKNVLPPETAINIAKRFLMKSKGIGGDGDLLSESFVFEGPVVGPLGKKQFVDAIGQVDFDAGFPDWKAQFYNFQVDVFDPERVWYMAKGEGTNTGPFPTQDLPATYKKVINPPQICSLMIDSETGLIKKYTIGYVADRNIGNTGGLGGLYGILYAIGRPLPFPEALPWKPSLPYLAFQKLGGLLRRIQKDTK
eukprot:scaffold3339_cov174-Amphora_coffeaeformis.AAC.10